MAQPTTGIFLNQSNPPATGGDQTVIFQTDNATPEQSVTAVPKRATLDLFGTVKPDGTTLQIGPDGTLFAVASGDGGGGGGTTGTTLVREDLTSFIDGSTQDFPLSFTPTGGVDIVFYNGVGLYPYDSSYSILGSTLHLNFAPVVSPVQDKLWILYSPSSGTTPTPPPPDPTPLALRGTSTGAAASGTMVVAFPSAAVAGDLVVICCNNDFNITAPSGWTTNNLSNGVTWNGMVCSKVMTAGDIAAGSVTIIAAGSDDWAYIATAFIGPTNGVREVDFDNTSGLDPVPVTTSSAVVAGDMALYYGSGRAAGTTISIDRGTAQAAVTGTNSQANLNTEQLTASGTFTTNFGWTGAGAGLYLAVVIVKS